MSLLIEGQVQLRLCLELEHNSIPLGLLQDVCFSLPQLPIPGQS